MGIIDRVKKAKKTAEEAERRIRSRIFSETSLRRPLRLQREILDEIEEKIELRNHTQPIFPFNRVLVYLLAEDSPRRTSLEAVLSGEESLSDHVVRRLTEAGARAPGNLKVEIKFVTESGDDWANPYFYVAFQRTGGRERRIKRSLESLNAHLTVSKGQAAQKTYSIRSSPFNIGRLREVTDNNGRILRRNDLVFLETGKNLSDENKEINKTVARQHAHVQFDGNAPAFRLMADAPTASIRIFRNGKIIKAPPIKSKGVKLESGDEIYLGKARLMFDFESR